MDRLFGGSKEIAQPSSEIEPLTPPSKPISTAAPEQTVEESSALKQEQEPDLLAETQALAEFLGIEDVKTARPEDWVEWMKHNMRSGQKYDDVVNDFTARHSEYSADVVARVLKSRIGPDYRGQLEA